MGIGVDGPLNVLFVDDSSDDTELVVRQLERDHLDIDWIRVDSSSTLAAALATRSWDVVLSDHVMPGFSSGEALALVREAAPDVPFLLVSGAIGEEAAVDQIRLGASDYISKDNLLRLEPAIQRSLADAVNRRERKQAEIELASHASQQTAVARLGAEALREGSSQTLMKRACEAVVDALRADCVAVVEHEPAANRLALRESVGLESCQTDSHWLPLTSNSHLGLTFLENRANRLRDLAGENWLQSGFRFGRPIRDGTAVAIRGTKRTFGAIGAYWEDVHVSTESEVQFLESVANVLAGAIEREEFESQIRRQALHDPLTGLPNRRLFLDRLQHWLTLAPRRGKLAAVLFLDLDRFKFVNDAYGHDAGDRLLLAVVPRLEGTLRPADTVSRFGGDEFAVLCEDINGENDAIQMAERLARAFEQPVNVTGIGEQTLSVSIGIALAGADADAGTLLRDADSAMYRAKERGGNGCELFDQAMHTRIVERMQLEEDLRTAIDERRLFNVYQPVVSLEDGHVIGFEALVRWGHPERGVLLPADFMSVAEQAGLVVGLGRDVLMQACRDGAGNGAGPLGAARMFVNISPRQMTEPGLVDEVRQALEATGLDPWRLEIELTETALIDDPERAGRILSDLSDMGVGVALDDFGTGFSSLSALSRFPIQTIKIDRSFIHGLDRAGDSAIVAAIISMARALGGTAVAEGIETEAQLCRVRGMGCELGQGFHFARPLPIGDARKLLCAAAEPASPGAVYARRDGA
jgi:diguanylate cyclase (GGDEF)-like protein